MLALYEYRTEIINNETRLIALKILLRFKDVLKEVSICYQLKIDECGNFKPLQLRKEHSSPKNMHVNV